MGNNDTDNDLSAHNGVHIKYDAVNSAWTYNDPSDLRYWPDYSLNFYAVSPGTVPEENSKDHYFGKSIIIHRRLYIIVLTSMVHQALIKS